MNFTAYKISFKSGVHIGVNSLNDGEFTLHADTLFSALCTEAVKFGEDTLNRFVKMFADERTLVSDAFPYFEDLFFLPKPVMHIESADNGGNSVKKKQFKKLKYITFENFSDFLNGSYEPTFDLEMISNLGRYGLRTSAAVSELEETKPYNVGVYTFNADCGLYFILGWSAEEERHVFEALLNSLAYSGIGGRRSTGLGRFTFTSEAVEDSILARLSSQNSGRAMTLSISLPTDDEMQKAIDGAEYSIIKRSGFSGASTQSQQTRNKDLYTFCTGSVFSNLYHGQIVDVSRNASHPVYRYAKPMWLEV